LIFLISEVKQEKKKGGREGKERFEGRRGGFRARRRNRRSGERAPQVNGKVEIFAFTVRQRKELTPVICIVGLGENEGVRLHVREPSFAHAILPEMFFGTKTPN